jgi:tetratricopeptide (TPR) repeat protein
MRFPEPILRATHGTGPLRTLQVSFRHAGRSLVGVVFALALGAASTSASAQPAPTPEEVQQAQIRWGEGKVAFDAGNYEAARIAFKQAFTVFPHPAFLQNLGEAELRTGRLVEAARHLSEYLRSVSNSGSPAQRDMAKKSLQKASARLGSLIIETNVTDAEVRVDDETVGRSPLGSAPWFVEPGRHTVTVRREGYQDAAQTVDVAVGPSKNVSIAVQPLAGAGAPAPGAASPSTAAPARAETPAAVAGSNPDRRAMGGEPAPVSGRTAVLVTGAGLALIGLGLGIAYTVKVSGDANDVDQASQAVQNAAGTDTRSCIPDSINALPAARRDPARNACDSLGRMVDRLHADQAIRDGSFVAGAVVGVATAAAFFLWPASRDPAASSIHAAPFASHEMRGIAVRGRF